jgi:hypothetical protein
MTLPATAFKSLAPNEYTVTPFRTYAQHTYTYVSGSTSNSNDVKVLFGKQYVTGSGLRVQNDEHELYDSIRQSFYSAIPYASYGIQSSSYAPTGSVFVITATQDLVGEEIKPGTFTVSIGTSSSYDDSTGNIFISQSGVGYNIGRIFYDKGIAVIKPLTGIAGGGITNNGICIVSGTNVNIQFTSSVKLFEHSVKVKLNPTDFLYSVYNPSSTKSMITGSFETPLTLMASQSLYPYITSIGLYNQDNELVAVAKLSNPIQRTDYSIQTFVVKFDT